MKEKENTKPKPEKRRLSTWIKILIALVVLNSLALLFNFFAVPEIKYQKALKLVDERQYASAIEIFTELGTYKDSAAQLIPIYDIVNSYIQVGSKVYFGTYEQDNNTTNGKEKIEWKVLAVEKDKALLISAKNLDCLPYSLEDKAMTWEKSMLRSWLNAEFLNAAFNQEEQEAILPTEVRTRNNLQYRTVGGEAVKDKIFILSIDEADQYFKSDRDRAAKNTPYAVEKKAFDSPEGNGWWWLRTPGIEENMASNVNYSGTIDEYGNYVYSFGGCVRPALWISQKDLRP